MRVKENEDVQYEVNLSFARTEVFYVLREEAAIA